MTPLVLHQRRSACRACSQYKSGACQKGHILSSKEGCPIGKFPAEREDYVAHSPNPTPVAKQSSCCGQQDVPDLTYAQALNSFQKSITEWVSKGMPFVNDLEYTRRQAICKSNGCRKYKSFQCQSCKCVVMAKAKLATESCPLKLW